MSDPGLLTTGGPCGPWATIDDFDSITCKATVTDDDEKNRWLQVATDLLWARTGRQWDGECEIALRPVGLGHRFESVAYPGVGAGYRAGFRCGCVGGTSNLVELGLPVWPVTSLTVTIDGVVLTEGVDYRIDGDRTLRRLNGVWPACQDLQAADDATGSFTLEISYGSHPPQAGVVAAASLACELMLAATGDEACRLPAGIAQMSRQDVTVVMASTEDLLAAGSTGLPLVEQFVKAYNPDGAARPARLRDPDDPLFVRRP